MNSYYHHYYRYLQLKASTTTTTTKKGALFRSSINSDTDHRMDTFSSVEYDQRVNQHHQQLDYGVEQNDTALFDNIINSYNEKSDHELDGTLFIDLFDTLIIKISLFRAIIRQFQRAKGAAAGDACDGAH